MTKKRGLLLVKLDPPTPREAEWNDWYDNTHVAARLRVPGFLHIRRFIKVELAPERFNAIGDGKYLTLYDLATTSVLKSKPYDEVKEREGALPSTSFEAITRKEKSLSRAVYEQIFSTVDEYEPPDTKFLFIVGHQMPRNIEKEFSAWYNTEHIPGMMRVPGFLNARRFVLAKGFPAPDPMVLPKYITVYDWKNDHVFEEPSFKKEADTPWSAWIRSRFERRIRLLYQRILP